MRPLASDCAGASFVRSKRHARTLESGHEVEPALSLYLRGLDVDDLAAGLYQGATRCYRALGRNVEAAALDQRWSRIREARLGDA
jgi:hypothetical protein